MIRYPARPGSSTKRRSGIALPGFIWVIFSVAALGLVHVVDPAIWTIAVVATAVVLALVLSSGGPPWHPSVDRRDLVALGLLYLVVVAMLRLAFSVIRPGNALGFWLTFGAALVIGVAGPILYQVRSRKRRLSSLGITRHHLFEALTLGLILAVVQFARTLWDRGVPELVDWLPLLLVSFVVGFFEVVFIRGFIQTRLEASLGTGLGVAGAALLYALYHWGYGIGVGDLWVLVGLGVVYGIAYRLLDSIFVLWPLVTPLAVYVGGLGVAADDVQWSTTAVIAVVALVMGGSVWWAKGQTRRRIHHVWLSKQ